MPLNGHRQNHQFDVEIRSDEVQEVLAKMPHWMIRWGLTVIFTIVVLAITMSWFVKYPDTVTARVFLTTEVPPSKIIAQSTGRIDLNVQNGEFVSAGDTLAVLKNAAVTHDVLLLRKWLESKEASGSLQIPKKNLQLGDLQVAYTNHINAISNERLRRELNEFEMMKSHLNKRIDHYKQLSIQLKREVVLLEQEVEIAQKVFDRQQKLFEKQVIAELDLDKFSNQLLRAKRQLETAKAGYIRNDIQISTLREQLFQSEVSFNEKTKLLQADVETSSQVLNRAISDWDLKYLMRSPITGQVTFYNYWRDDQYVNAGEEVMTVVPDQQSIFGQVYLPIAGSGKVKPGQKVIIRFDNYPDTEFGMVKGEVQNISLVPRDDQYVIRVSFPEGLKTSYDKQLTFRQEMSGAAEIVTEELRLIHRIFNQMKNLFDQI